MVVSAELNALKEVFEPFREQAIEDYFQFLRFASISTEAAHHDEMKICVEWLKNFIEKLEFRTELWETWRHPVLFASYDKAGPDQPTLLIYNHYDVQPVDPEHLWDSPPFEPTIREGDVFARGAQDNKGQCMYVLQALKLLLTKEGKLPVNVKLCIEGEEEAGSLGLSEILKEKAPELKADYLAIVDLGLKGPDAPAITLGVRGIVALEVEVIGSKTDLHSGTHGGLAYNPIHGLVKMLTALRDEKGKILVDGFYDDVVNLNEAERSELTTDFDIEKYEATFGAKPTGGESDYSPVERAWIRPTIEVNGIQGGYSGDGFKTVIPARAIAKISCRLVPYQKPEVIAKLIGDYFHKLVPEGLELNVIAYPGGGEAVRATAGSHIVLAFSEAYADVFQKEVAYIFEGASIPIIPELTKASQAEVVLVGMGLGDDNIHAPNEHFSLDRFEKGLYVIARTLQNLRKK